MGKGGTTRRGFGALGLHAGQTLGGTVVGGGVQTLLHTALTRRPDRNLSGGSVVGSHNADQFNLTAPAGDGFTVTLPGASTLGWQVSVGARAAGDPTASLTVAVNSTTYPTVSIGAGDTGYPSVTLLGYGGDSFICEALVTGIGEAIVDLEFTAIRLS